MEEIAKRFPQLLGKQEVGGRTALFYAVQHDIQELVTPLLPELNIKDDNGMCSLSLAILIGDKQMVELLASERDLLDDVDKQ